jgi:hypothetical protein
MLMNTKRNVRPERISKGEEFIPLFKTPGLRMYFFRPQKTLMRELSGEVPRGTLTSQEPVRSGTAASAAAR